MNRRKQKPNILPKLVYTKEAEKTRLLDKKQKASIRQKQKKIQKRNKKDSEKQTKIQKNGTTKKDDAHPSDFHSGRDGGGRRNSSFNFPGQLKSKPKGQIQSKGPSGPLQFQLSESEKKLIGPQLVWSSTTPEFTTTMKEEMKNRLNKVRKNHLISSRQFLSWTDFRKLSESKNLNHPFHLHDNYYFLKTGEKAFKVFIRHLEVCDNWKDGLSIASPRFKKQTEIFLRGTFPSGQTVVVRVTNFLHCFFIRLKKGETTVKFLAEWNRNPFWRNQIQKEIKFVYRLPLMGYTSRKSGHYQILAKIYCYSADVMKKLVKSILANKFAVDKRQIITEYFNSEIRTQVHNYSTHQQRKKTQNSNQKHQHQQEQKQQHTSTSTTLEEKEDDVFSALEKEGIHRRFNQPTSSHRQGEFEEEDFLIEKEEKAQILNSGSLNHHKEENLEGQQKENENFAQQDEVDPMDQPLENEREILHTTIPIEVMFFISMLRIRELSVGDGEEKLHLPISELWKTDNCPSETNPRFTVPGWVALKKIVPDNSQEPNSLFTSNLVCEIKMEDLEPIEPRFLYQPFDSLRESLSKTPKQEQKPFKILDYVPEPESYHVCFDLETKHESGLKFADAPKEAQNVVDFAFLSFYKNYNLETPFQDDVALVLGAFDFRATKKKFPTLFQSLAHFKEENILCFENEFELLTVLCEFAVTLNDSDSLVGHNIVGYDLPFLISRGEYYSKIGKPNPFAEWSCIKNLKMPSRNSRKIFGRCCLDSLLLVKKLLPFKSFDDYKLKTLALNVLPQERLNETKTEKTEKTEKEQETKTEETEIDKGRAETPQNSTKNVVDPLVEEENNLIEEIQKQLQTSNVKKDLDYKVMDAYFSRARVNPLYILLFYIYAQEDAHLPPKIIHKLNLQRLANELTKITNVTFHDLISKGQTIRSFNVIMMEIEKSHRYINYDYVLDALVMALTTYKGGNVYDTVVSFSLTPLAFGDYEGLYPSAARDLKSGYSNLAVDQKQKESAKGDDYDLALVPSPWRKNFAFVKAPSEEDPLINTWCSISNLRSLEKKKKKDAEERKQFEVAAQAGQAEQGLKLTGNSVYGTLGASSFSLWSIFYPLGYKIIAYSITFKGRIVQKQAINIMETKFNLKTFAGDTDSVVSQFPQLERIWKFHSQWKANLTRFCELNEKWNIMMVQRQFEQKKVSSMKKRSEEKEKEIEKEMEKEEIVNLLKEKEKCLENQKRLQIEIFTVYFNYLKQEICVEVTEQLKSKDIKFAAEGIALRSIFMKKKKYFIWLFDEDSIKNRTLGNLKSRGMVNRNLPPFLRSVCKKIVTILFEPGTEDSQIFGFIGYVFEPQNPLAEMVLQQKFIEITTYIEEVADRLSQGNVNPEELILTQAYKEGKKSRAKFLAEKMKMRKQPVSYDDRINYLKIHKSKEMPTLGSIIQETKDGKAKNKKNARDSEFEESGFFLSSFNNLQEVNWAKVLDLRWYYTQMVKLLTNILVVPPGLFSADLLERILTPSFINLSRTSGRKHVSITSLLFGKSEQSEQNKKQKIKE